MISRIRTGVFFGGPSVEHEVSVISAMQAIQALNAARYEIIPVYIAKDGRFFTGPDLSRLETFRDIPAAIRGAREVVLERRGQEVCLLLAQPKRFGSPVVTALDVAIPVLHGTGGEDGVMQALFQRLGLPYAGPNVTASAIGMDKWASKALFRAQGLPCVPGLRLWQNAYYADPDSSLARLEREIGFPMVVKPYNQGSSVGIHKCRTRAELESGLEDAFLYSAAVVAEQAVPHLREINCAVLGDESALTASVCEEPRNATDILTYADKYQSGGKSGKLGSKSSPGGSKGMESLARIIPAPISQEQSETVQRLAKEAFLAIGAAGCARVDFLMNGETGELFVNEINTIPGSLAFYLWERSGLPFSQLMDRLVELALKRRREESRLHTSFDTNLLQNARLGGAKSGKKV